MYDLLRTAVLTSQEPMPFREGLCVWVVVSILRGLYHSLNLKETAPYPHLC